MAAPPTVRVRLPAALRSLADGATQLRGEGATVGEVLRSATRDFPQLQARLLDETGQLRRYVTFFRNDEDVRGEGGAHAPVQVGDELTIVPALSGG